MTVRGDAGWQRTLKFCPSSQLVDGFQGFTQRPRVREKKGEEGRGFQGSTHVCLALKPSGSLRWVGRQATISLISCTLRNCTQANPCHYCRLPLDKSSQKLMIERLTGVVDRSLTWTLCEVISLPSCLRLQACKVPGGAHVLLVLVSVL